MLSLNSVISYFIYSRKSCLAGLKSPNTILASLPVYLESANPIAEGFNLLNLKFSTDS